MQADVDVATPILSTFILGGQINAGHSKKKKKTHMSSHIYISTKIRNYNLQGTVWNHA